MFSRSLHLFWYILIHFPHGFCHDSPQGKAALSHPFPSPAVYSIGPLPIPTSYPSVTHPRNGTYQSITHLNSPNGKIRLAIWTQFFPRISRDLSVPGWPVASSCRTWRPPPWPSRCQSWPAAWTTRTRRWSAPAAAPAASYVAMERNMVTGTDSLIFKKCSLMWLKKNTRTEHVYICNYIPILIIFHYIHVYIYIYKCTCKG